MIELIDFLAKSCHYAQSHTIGWEEDCDNINWVNIFQCTSFQVACFIAQNTKYGHEGVEWDIIIKELSERPIKSVDEWKGILEEKCKLYESVEAYKC